MDFTKIKIKNTSHKWPKGKRENKIKLKKLCTVTYLEVLDNLHGHLLYKAVRLFILLWCYKLT